MTKLVLVALACLLLVNCATVLVNAPRGKTVTLLSNEPATLKVTLRNWYLLWGLIPLTNNNTATMIGRCNLENVRVKVYYTPLQRLANLIMVLGLVETNTVLIEGIPGNIPSGK
jgi:hypothetical protein